MPPLRIAVVGLGRMGVVHARNLSGRVTRARLSRVSDVDATLARRVGEELGVPWCVEAEQLAGDRGVDAVVIATPPASHAALIVQAAYAGLPVLCEKPLAYELGEGLAAVEAADRAGVQLQVGFHRRFDRDYGVARAYVEAGDLGTIQTFLSSMRDMRPPPEPVLRRERLLHDATSHDLDIARWLVGEVVDVTAFGTRLSAPVYAEIGEYDNVVTVLRFAGGGLGVIDNGRAAAYGFECRTEVVGSRATLRIGDPRVSHVERLTPTGSRHDLTPTFLERFSSAYVAELEAFASAIQRGEDVRVTGQDGLAALRLSLAAERSLRAGGTVELDPRADGAGRKPGGVLQHARA